MTELQMILDALPPLLAAIAWPVFGIVVAVKVWPTVKDLLPSLRRVEVGSVAIDVAQQSAEVSLAAIADEQEGTTVTTDEGPSEPPSERVETPAPADPELSLSRGELESIVKTFATAGWTMGSSGKYVSAPTPQIEWDESGRPTISSWEGRRSRPAPSQPESTLTDLERELIDAMSAYKASGVGIAGDRTRLARVQTLYRMVEASNPKSPVLKGLDWRDASLLKML